MNKIILSIIFCMIATISSFAQYTTTYRNSYGSTIGTSSTRSNYGGGTTTTYSDAYGRTIGTATTRSNYGGGSTTTYTDAYGRTIGTSTSNW